jgi:hypothetical protein
MGLFDGQVKAFATKISTALRGRAEVRRKIAQQQDKDNAKLHMIVAITLDDVAEVIDEVAKSG